MEDVEALRAHLGQERLSILAWAYAGGVALRYALAHPDRVERLVLVAPLPPRRSPHWNRFLQRFVGRSDLEALARIDELRESGFKRRHPERYCREVVDASLAVRLADPAHAQRMQSDPCAGPNVDPDETARLLAGAVDALGDWDWRDEMSRLDVPVLIVHGRADLLPIEGSEEYAGALPNATLLSVDAGHLPWLETPATFFPAVLAFLEGDPLPHE